MRQSKDLEHFPTKSIPVGRKKVLKANNLDRLSDSQGSENGLERADDSGQTQTALEAI
jgi:hypothetical protein